MFTAPQFPLINLYEPHDECASDTFSLALGENEVTEIRKRLALGCNEQVNRVEACLDGQVRRRYTVEHGEIVRGVHFSPIDYQCSQPRPLRIPPAAARPGRDA